MTAVDGWADSAGLPCVGCHRLSTLAAGRTLEQKRDFYEQVADELNRRLGVRRQDVFINLVPVDPTDWSFGNGKASLVKDKWLRTNRSASRAGGYRAELVPKSMIKICLEGPGLSIQSGWGGQGASSS